MRIKPDNRDALLVLVWVVVCVHFGWAVGEGCYEKRHRTEMTNYCQSTTDTPAKAGGQ